MTTLKISIYAGILIALPVLLYQVYAFVLPALKPTEKRVVLPFLLLVPLLFIAGVVFSLLRRRPGGDSSSCSTSTRASSTSRCGPASTTASSSSP